jgi:hypothetical protein
LHAKPGRTLGMGIRGVCRFAERGVKGVSAGIALAGVCWFIRRVGYIYKENTPRCGYLLEHTVAGAARLRMRGKGEMGRTRKKALSSFSPFPLFAVAPS